MEEPILITWLNDYVFCPKSIYYHNLYGTPERIAFQEKKQIEGTKAHESIDSGSYSSRKEILCGISVYSEQYNLTGKIDIFDANTGTLKSFDETDSVYVIKLSQSCEVKRYGYAKHEESDLLIVT